MDEEEKFRGFPEGDEILVSVQDKIGRIKAVLSKLETLQRKEETECQTTASSSEEEPPVRTRPKRPPNRFLRGSGSASVAGPAKVKTQDDKKFHPVVSSSDSRMIQPSLVQDKPNSIPEVSTQIVDINGSSTVLLAKEKLPPMPSLVKYTPVALPKPPALKRINVKQNELESTMPLLSPNAPTHQANTKSAPPPRRANKFLKVKTSNCVDDINKMNGDLSADNIKLKVVEPLLPASPASSHSSDSFTQERQLPAKGKPTVAGPTKPVDVKDKVNTLPAPEVRQLTVETVESSSSSCNSVDEKSDLVRKKPPKIDKEKLVSNQSIEKQAPISKASCSKPPSPAKRTSSTPGLNFLNGQTSRSKRTIVPNKRFFSTDDDSPSAPLKHEEKNASVRRVVEKPVQTGKVKKAAELKVLDKPKEDSIGQDRVKGKRKRNFSAETNGISGSEFVIALNKVPVTKKQADSVDTASKKRKISIENNQNPVADPPSNTSTVVDDPGSNELAARPRRTIIPNRKFLDEAEPPKEVVSKKTEVNEPKRKRRKSEKSENVAQNVVQPVADEEVEVTRNLCESEPKPLIDNCGASTVESVDKRTVADTCEPIPASDTSSANGSSSVNISGAKAESKSKVQDDDEVPLVESEADFYKGNSAFLGACVLKTSGDQASNAGSSEAAVICCGICGRIKKYRALAEKRKRGSFLCSECGDVVNTIFATAMKAKPFSCIVGPPICEGSCPVLFTPPDQFCEACFAKTCLKNLPMKDDIYFKIWRAIPPLSRGCVSTTPVVNPNTPNVGKVVQANESGAVLKATSSLKMLASKRSNQNGIDVNQEDSSNSSDNKNGDVDLISARITTFSHSHRTDSASSSNCENLVPKNSIDESHSLENANNVKATGVSKEEMLLGRQTGQERVKALVDPILKPDIDDVEIFGFPVVVCGTAYPRKPLCFLCGSSGIEQLIFCNQCCEPYHPYCAGDDLLLNTNISRYNNCQESQTSDNNSIEEKVEGCGGSTHSVLEKKADVDDSRIVVKWTCRRCMACKGCGVSIGREELIRCSRCRNPYHLDTCIDKRFLSKIKDLDKLKKLWTCDTCLKCTSCGKKIEASRKILPIKVTDEDVNEMDSGVSSQGNCLMLCINCFKQRKKGSFCPFCDVSYNDDDWESKMMECCKCKRWIHASCEKLSDEGYDILSILPTNIDYICRLCEPSENPLWYSSIQSQISNDCNSVINLFEEKTLGSLRKKSSSIDLKPDDDDDDDADSTLSTLVPSDEDDDYRNEIIEGTFENEDLGKTPRLRQNIRKRVSEREILTCKVHLRDFIKFPQTLEETWYAFRELKIEGRNGYQDMKKRQEVRTPTRPIHYTPIHNTPAKCFTPTKHISSVCESIRSDINSLKSLRTFQNLVVRAIKNSGEGETGVKIMIDHAKEAMKEVIPWCKQSWPPTDEADVETFNINSDDDKDDDSCITSDLITSDPFKEVFWNANDFFDNRKCVLCEEVGDFPPDSCGRLLWAGVKEWIHCNCALWSSEVFELDSGALQRIGAALSRGRSLRCVHCKKKGATVSCCHSGCKQAHYHFLCAREANCSLFRDKRMFCPKHQLSEKQKEEIQHEMKIGRKVFVDFDGLQKREQKAFTDDIKVFVGSLRVDSIGRIVPISVTNKSWDDESNKTFLSPSNFKAQRVFWSSEDPWQKQCYTFETGISSNGFENKVHDVGINLVVDHLKNEESVQKGLNNINWLPRCSKEFNIDESSDEFDIFSSRRKTSCSPVSVSSFGSFNKLTPTSRFMGSSFRKITERTERDAVETATTEGYSSAADDCMNGTVTKASERNKKRRRSSCKKRTKQHKPNLKATLSPRRRSMRNRRYLPEDNCDFKIDKPTESDDDSRVLGGSSATGSFDGDRPRCRVNLMAQFNDSNLGIANNDMISEASFMDRTCQTPDDHEDDFEFSSCSTKSDNEVYHAAIKFEVKSDKSGSCFHSCDARSTWMYVFESVSKSRLDHKLTSLIQPTLGSAVSGNKLELANSFRMLGITHRSVQYLIEQLPGKINVVDKHTFQYCSKPYIDSDNNNVPAIINPMGCARSEGFIGRKPFDMFGFLASSHREYSMSCNLPEDTLRNKELPLAMRYRGLKDNSTKAREKYVVRHSNIHGRGLYARWDMEKGDIIIEYAGEVIRPSLTDLREKYYESRGIGCYMFRINDTQVIDATLKGNAARFINHSCEPNCEAKTVRVLGKNHILIFALRKIFNGEELTYDYKFEREEKKILCSCGASRCRKYMN